MTSPFAPAAEAAYALVRIAAGLMFTFHGAQKLFGFLMPEKPPVGSLLWFAGIVEFSCGLLVALGLFTAYAAFLASGEMAFAYCYAHWRFHGGAQAIPIVNKGELAVLYATLFLYVACRGAGRYGIDRAAAPVTTTVVAPGPARTV